TTRNVLTLEYREGINLNRYMEDQAADPPPREVAEILADAFFKQVFVDGFFHGDPHPGNIAVLPGGKLFFMDFGSAGFISDSMRSKFIIIVRAFQSMDTAAVVDELLDFAFVPPGINRLELIRDIDELQEQYFEIPLKNIVAGEAIQKLMQIAVKHRLRFPHEFILLAKAAMTLEGTVLRLDPKFSLASAAAKYAPAMQRRELKLEMRRLRGTLRGYRRLMEVLPEHAVELLRNSAAGELKIKVELPQVDPVMKTVKHAVNRLGFSIILASLIIGLSQNIKLGTMSWLEKIPLGEIVLIGAILAGLWWIFAVIRSGRL
ncbi:MAG: AarF/ABC1/UbiB kinase family protein, partial [Firmicutes bacterium]|nr:AarF/ABC1/UbiB kinase family protein [Bacillota bacterium]